MGAPLNAPGQAQPADGAHDNALAAPREQLRNEPSEPAAAVPRFDNDPPREQPAEPAQVAPTEEGTGRPGDPQLSGTQAPTLAIEKLAPAEIQIGKPAKFLIKVTNTGSVAAHGVEIRDAVPKGTQLIETSPTAERGPQGALVWQLGTMKPGDEQTVEVQLMPTAEGEIGSVATVHFAAQASVRTVSTKPMLSMDVSGPSKVLKGQPVSLKIKLSNPGTGAATGIVLSESVPDVFAHESGSELEFEVGTLKPGESRELNLELQAAAAGVATNVIIAQGEGNLRAEQRADVEVVALNCKSRWPDPSGAISSATPRTRFRSAIPAPPRPRTSSWWPCCRKSSNSSKPTMAASSTRRPIACTGASKSCRHKKPEP